MFGIGLILLGVGIISWGALRGRKQQPPAAHRSFGDDSNPEINEFTPETLPQKMNSDIGRFPLTDVTGTHREFEGKNALQRPFVERKKQDLADRTIRVVKKGTEVIQAVGDQHKVYQGALNELQELRQKSLELQQEEKRIKQRDDLLPLEKQKEEMAIRAQIAENEAKIADSKLKVAKSQRELDGLDKPAPEPPPPPPKPKSGFERRMEIHDTYDAQMREIERRSMPEEEKLREIEALDSWKRKELNRLHE